jgi:hypothetical protein
MEGPNDSRAAEILGHLIIETVKEEDLALLEED